MVSVISSSLKSRKPSTSSMNMAIILCCPSTGALAAALSVASVTSSVFSIQLSIERGLALDLGTMETFNNFSPVKSSLPTNLILPIAALKPYFLIME